MRLLLFVSLGACGSSRREVPADSDSDTDTDADTDIDTDADTDSDSDGCVVLDPDSWTVETVDASGETGRWASVAVDGAGRPHVAYQDVTNGDLRWALEDGDAWTLAPVDPGAGGLAPTAIAVDSAGASHVVWIDGSTNDVSYATDRSGDWVRETLDAWPIGGTVAVAADAGGAAHALWADSVAHELVYATNATGSWSTEVVDVCDESPYGDLALDSSGGVHVAYGCPGLRHAVRRAADWEIDDVDVAALSDTDPSIDVDAAGVVHVAYRIDGIGGAPPEMRYATGTAGIWSLEAPLVGAGPFVSMAVDGAGVAHVGVFDDDALDPVYMRRAGVMWILQTPDSKGDVGQYLSLALGGDAVHLAYFDATNGDLKYARAGCD